MTIVASLILAACTVSPEAEFWAWFDRNSTRLASIKSATEPIADELANRLKRVDPDLTFEMQTSRRPYELVISAGGIKRAFPAVQRLVAAAPAIDGWKVVAFRPPRPGHTVEVGGYQVDPADVWFKAEPDGLKCGITVYLPDYRDTQDVNLAGYLLLDGSLGEYNVETKLGYIVFEPLPIETGRSSLTPLSELPTVVNALVP